jgi:glycosyltransferase involved in cell wall biosynthesis
MDKITVLYLIDVLAQIGGAERNLFYVVSGLDPQKYRFIVCCLQGGEMSDLMRKKGITVIDLDLKRIYGVDALKKAFWFMRLIKKEKVRVMVTCFEGSDFWGSLTGRCAGVPLLISNRRDMGHNLKQRHVLAYRLFNLLFKKIITVSEKVKVELSRTQHVPMQKMVTIYNGVELGEFEKQYDTDGIKHAFGVSNDEIVVTMVARLDPVKGHKHYLEAACLVLKKNKAVRFLVVGGDKAKTQDYLRELQDYVRHLGINEKVIFTGARNDIAGILAMSDVLVLSSLSEGFSNTIIEYMAAGKPVVATDVGGNDEVIADEVTGFLVPAGDPIALAEKIISLLDNKKLRDAMGEKAKAVIHQSFSMAAMLTKVDQLFAGGACDA